MAQYASLAEANRWFEARRIESWTQYDEAGRTAALLRASEWIDRYFAFIGQPLDPSQIRAWPRVNASLPDGRAITGIPDAVLEAVYILAQAMLDDDETALAALGLGPQISQQKAGGVEIRYAKAGKNSSRIERMLAPLVMPTHDRLIRRS